MMFIKLTRFTGVPIWFNAGFLVTVEPRNGGGSIVVPVGDGLDYDVKESPEEIVAALEGVPAPAVIPIPNKDSIPPPPATTSEEKPSGRGDRPAEEAKPAKKPRATKAKTKKTLKAEAKAAAEKTLAADSIPVAKPEPVEAPAPVEKPSSVLHDSQFIEEQDVKSVAISDEDFERLKKLAPKTIRKLRNTITAQLKAGDAEGVVKGLVERGAILLTGASVKWIDAT